MRFLLYRSDGIGDLVVSLPVQNCILDSDPSAEVFWLVRPEVAPVLEHLPGVSGVLHKLPDSNLERLIKYVKPDVLLNLVYNDSKIIYAAKKAGVPIRVAWYKGLRESLSDTLRDRHLDRIIRSARIALRHILNDTHIICNDRNGSGRHESQYNLDLLRKLKWLVPESIPPPPKLVLTQEEIAIGKADLQSIAAPRLGVITRGVTGFYPSQRWWKKMMEDSKVAGWNPVILSPPDECSLPPTSLRGLMSRLYACDAVLSVSTGPAHLSAALGVPTLCLMERDRRVAPHRWMVLGDRAESIAYPGKKVKVGEGMDRFSPDMVLTHLEKL